jgi:hypothetical protein
MHLMRNGFWLLSALLLSACASGSAGMDPVFQPSGIHGVGGGADLRLSETGSIAETTVGISPAAAWLVLPQVYDSLGLGGGVLNAQARSYGNPRVSVRTIAGSRVDRLFRCANEGTGPSSVSRLRIRFSIFTTVSEAGEGEAQIRTSVVATGSPREGTSTSSVVCISKGMLESAIERQVANRAGAPAGPGG